MSISPTFKSVAMVLGASDWFSGSTYGLLTLTEQIVGCIPEPEKEAHEWTHEQLVAIAADSVTVREHLYDGKLIAGIKQLRTIAPGTRLKAAKDAVEDYRVKGLYYCAPRY